MVNFCGVMVSNPLVGQKKGPGNFLTLPPSDENSGPLAGAAGTSTVDGPRGPPFRSDGLELIGGHLARALVGDQLKADLLTFAQIAHPRAFDGADMNEGVLTAVVGLDEAEAFLRVKPLYAANRPRDHVSIFRGSSSVTSRVFGS